MLRIIHILSSLDKINFGIWNAALFGTDYLKNIGIETEAWVTTDTGKRPESFPEIHVEFIGVSPSNSDIRQRTSARQLRSDNTVIVSHGVWLSPSSVGNQMHAMGFKWIYAPHGMFEPWGMSQNAFKKKLYFWLYERNFARKATRIRAVSSIEQTNLNVMFKKPVVLIENGVKMPPLQPKPSGVTTFLFLGRLHHKKGIACWSKRGKK